MILWFLIFKQKRIPLKDSFLLCLIDNNYVTECLLYAKYYTEFLK